MLCKMTARRELVAPTNHPAQAHQVESIGAVVGGYARHSDQPARAGGIDRQNTINSFYLSI